MPSGSSAPSGRFWRDPATRVRAVFLLEHGRLATFYLDTGEWESGRPSVSLVRLQLEVGPYTGTLPTRDALAAAAQRADVTLLSVLYPN